MFYFTINYNNDYKLVKILTEFRHKNISKNTLHCEILAPLKI